MTNPSGSDGDSTCMAGRFSFPQPSTHLGNTLATTSSTSEERSKSSKDRCRLSCASAARMGNCPMMPPGQVLAAGLPRKGRREGWVRALCLGAMLPFTSPRRHWRQEQRRHGGQPPLAPLSTRKPQNSQQIGMGPAHALCQSLQCKSRLRAALSGPLLPCNEAPCPCTMLASFK